MEFTNDETIKILQEIVKTKDLTKDERLAIGIAIFELNKALIRNTED